MDVALGHGFEQDFPRSAITAQRGERVSCSTAVCQVLVNGR
ncbi:MAG: hypothetical protein OXO51_05175 [Gemmatimonadota bacterium]|nr:hypothetical protein [Gemmatimonadota bacterium]